MDLRTLMVLAWGIAAAAVVAFGWLWNKASPRNRARLDWGLLLFVGLVSLLAAATHEPWRDELHAWLQARDMGLVRLWREMAFEGHFLPWYLLLWPMAHFGAPVWTMGVLSWLLNLAAFALLALRSPLTGWEKAAAGVSCLFLYVNPAISRCYVLVPLALFALARLWPERRGRPVAFAVWVALLANTHLCLEGAVVALFVLCLAEALPPGRATLRQWIGLAVMAAGGLLALAQVAPALWKSSVVLGGTFGWREETRLFFSPCIPGASAAVALALALLAIDTARRDRAAFAVLAAGLAWMWAFAVFLYSANTFNRILLWWPLALFAAFAAAGGRPLPTAPRILALVAVGLGLARPDFARLDFRGDYDPLPAACRWIARQQGPDSELWVDGGDFATEAATAFLPNVIDWRSGLPPAPISWARAPAPLPLRPFAECAADVFRTRPETTSFLALASLSPWSGVAPQDLERPGIRVEHVFRSFGPATVPLVAFRVSRPPPGALGD